MKIITAGCLDGCDRAKRGSHQSAKPDPTQSGREEGRSDLARKEEQTTEENESSDKIADCCGCQTFSP